MTFRFANIAGRAALVDAQDAWYDLERLTDGAVSSDPMAAWNDQAGLHAAAARLDGATADGDLATATVLAPIPRPRNCFAVGLNYGKHAAESGMALPEFPLLFTKFPSCISAPDTHVELACETGDYEVELVVVIGTGGRHISEADAWSHIGGVTIGQDISDRALQFAAKPAHFDLGKSRDTYGPLGPVVVSTDSFTGGAAGGDGLDVADLAISCTVNGEVRQSDRTSGLIFGVPRLVSYLSSILTLEPGDIIFTGTPDGVGMATGNFLKPGDVIVSTIEGVGTITNRCVA